MNKCDLQHDIYEELGGSREVVKTVDCKGGMLKAYEFLRISKDSVVFDGVYKEFFNDGKLYKIGFFKMNVQDSIVICYREDGSKELDNYRVNGRLKGFQNYYDVNDRVVLRKYYINDSDFIFQISYGERGSIDNIEGKVVRVFYDKDPSDLKIGESLFIGNEVPTLDEMITEIHIKLVSDKGEKIIDTVTRSFQCIDNVCYKGAMFSPSSKGS